jgi:LasA protease
VKRALFIFLHRWLVPAVLVLAILLSGCQAQVGPLAAAGQAAVSAVEAAPLPQDVAGIPTPFPTRPIYQPGELVDYTAQPGDTLPVLAVRFNTTVAEILEANSFIPATATTMPPGMPMKIPIYYLPFWGSPNKILPDSQFVNGPAQIGFDTQTFVAGYPGWLKGYKSYVSDANRTGAQIVDLIAQKYSISPRLLLALLEYQAGALTQAEVPEDVQRFPLGSRTWERDGLFLQLVWATNLLNGGYYRYKKGLLTSLDLPDGRIERIDPWQNAASVSLMNYFNSIFDEAGFRKATSAEGFFATYSRLFGDPWQNDKPNMEGSLAQPEFVLPFEPGSVWAFTGGPHTGWGQGEPMAALDFAPPSETQGCVETDQWATAMASGVVARTDVGEVTLDLDGDGDERTGWVIFYLHVSKAGRPAVGTVLKAGDRLGHPSCEGGSSTGTHLHVARKYNGEWVPASGYGGVLPFTFEGWVAHDGAAIYLGTLTRGSQVVTACTCSNRASFIQTGRQ